MRILAIVTWCNANSGFIMAILTLVYVGATVWLVKIGKDQIRHSLRLEKNRTRPFVIIDLVTEHHCLYLRLSNVGLTPASNVRITISPNLKAVVGNNASHDIPFLEREIPMFSPGRTLNAFVAHWGAFIEHYKSRRFEGTISYHDSLSQDRFEETFILDKNTEEGILSVGRKDIDDVGRSLESIAKSLASLSSSQRPS